LARKRPATLSLIDAFASDPFLRFLDDAPVDDEPVTAEEEAAIAEVERDRAAGVPTIPFDDVSALTPSRDGVRCGPVVALQTLVDVPPVRDADDDDATALVVDLVDDPPGADADPVVTASG
jgi:hypothetical protein